MTTVVEAPEALTGGVFMSPEKYAAYMEKDDAERRAALLRRVRDMLNPNSTRTRDTFDPNHIQRISNHQVYLYVRKPTATCKAMPFIIPRKK